MAGKEETLQLFLRCGLEEKTAQNVLANSKVTVNFCEVLKEAGLENGCDRAVGNLVYTVATKFPANALKHRFTLLSYITSLKIKTVLQLDTALSFLATVGEEPLSEEDFSKKCGVGVEVSLDDVRAAVKEVIEKEKTRLLAERYRVNVGGLLGQVRTLQPWADGKLARAEMEAQMKELLGERIPEDDEKPKKKDKKKKGEEKVSTPLATSGSPPPPPSAPPSEEVDPYAQFPKPEDNNQVHTEIFMSSGEIWRPHNSRERLQNHLKATGGKIMSRFPPEPNGYLHIGHAKAMNVSFGLAKERGGNCYLRFDDTNPESEKQEYIDHIQSIVGWLGWKPWKVTYSSDYFQDLYELAVELIKKGYAYVDHQTGEEIKEYREKKKESPWRNRPIEESLREFEEMRRGGKEEGEATLRMKQDMGNENPNMYDLIAYRIKYTEHPHSGDKWCIYPSYDYTHCIVDSLENITHSLCTLEFETRRASYYWLLEALGLYHPHVWEYARLSITNTVLSKRKLHKLVSLGLVLGWDDPRLLTLAGLKRRGFTSSSINAFCQTLGITRSDNVIRVELLEHFVRDDLNRRARRAMVVLHPLKVVIQNFPEGKIEEMEAKFWPDAKEGEEGSTYKVPFCREVFIEASDFRVEDKKDYYGLAPGKTVMLRYAYPIKCTKVVYEEDGSTVKEVFAEYDPAKTTKPKGVIHWVGNAGEAGGPPPLKVEIRLIEKLFMSENPNEYGDDWLKDLNPKSMEVIKEAFAVPALENAEIESKFQFERIGYFCVDTDSKPGNLVFNRTVTLRDSYPKFGGK